MEGLRRQQPTEVYDALGGRIRPPILDARLAARIYPHSLLWIPGEPPSVGEDRRCAATDRRAADRPVSCFFGTRIVARRRSGCGRLHRLRRRTDPKSRHTLAASAVVAALATSPRTAPLATSLVGYIMTFPRRQLRLSRRSRTPFASSSPGARCPVQERQLIPIMWAAHVTDHVDDQLFAVRQSSDRYRQL